MTVRSDLNATGGSAWRISIPRGLETMRPTRLTEQGIDVVRLGYSDLIGTDRGRDVLVNRFARTVGGGVAFCRSVYGTTPMGDVVDIEGGLAAGLPDIVAFPDMSTAAAGALGTRASRTVIADVFNPDGSPRRRARGRC